MELKHCINGARGAEISKIRPLRPKQRRFGLYYRKKKPEGFSTQPDDGENGEEEEKEGEEEKGKKKTPKNA